MNCFQILYIRSLNTIAVWGWFDAVSCELLSDFVYSFFEHNWKQDASKPEQVVNCFQILYIRSLNTISEPQVWLSCQLWIAFRFCIFVLWTQSIITHYLLVIVVNCFQILYIRSLNTIGAGVCQGVSGCELLSDFVYSFFEHNVHRITPTLEGVVNCFQILYIRSLNTMIFTGEASSGRLWIAFRFCIFVLWTQWLPPPPQRRVSCELLSDFVYSFFEHNYTRPDLMPIPVVNCFQILYIRSLNTIGFV